MHTCPGYIKIAGVHGNFTFALRMTRASSRNIGKSFFSELKLVFRGPFFLTHEPTEKPPSF